MSNQTERQLELRVPFEEGRLLRDYLSKSSGSGCERVALGLATHATAKGADLVLIRAVFPVPDEAYQSSSKGTSWDSKFTAFVLSQGMKASAGIVMIHRHEFGNPPSLSSMDRLSFNVLHQRARFLLPNSPHGSVVLGREGTVGGLFSLGNGVNMQVTRTNWIGPQLEIAPRVTPPRVKRVGRYGPQIKLIGEDGQALLADGKLAIVGVGGGGSHILQQAAYAGVGTLIIVDPDKVDEGNLSRMIGAKTSDIGSLKVEVLERYAKWINPDVKIVSVPERFPSKTTISALKEADILVGCLDSLTYRQELLKFAWRYLTPLIDIGLGSSLANSPRTRKLQSIAGHVHVYLPGGPCMYDTGLLSAAKLEAESGGKPEYVEGVSSPGQIVSFNGVVSSYAMVEVMQMLTGFMARAKERPFLQYDGLTGTVETQIAARSPSCDFCSSELGMGDPVIQEPTQKSSRSDKIGADGGAED